jgi:uncharacterized membrane protein YtjA (UPF0391 family)
MRGRRGPHVPVRVLVDAHAKHDNHIPADDRARPGHHDHDGDTHELEIGPWGMTKAGRRPFPTASTTIDHIIPMLSWVFTFFIIALIAGALGFTGIAGTSFGIAQTLFYIFLVLFVISLLVHIVRGGGSKTDL